MKTPLQAIKELPTKSVHSAAFSFEDQKDGYDLSPMATPMRDRPPSRRSKMAPKCSAIFPGASPLKRRNGSAEAFDCDHKDEDLDCRMSLASLNWAISNDNDSDDLHERGIDHVDDSDSDGQIFDFSGNLNDSDQSADAQPSDAQPSDAQPSDVQPLTPFAVSECEVAADEQNEITKVLEVAKWADWEKCMVFSRDGGLVVAELYSVVFGPSLAMEPFIVEMLQKEHAERDVQFVRLSLHRLNTIELVREAIVDYDRYYPTPVPLFLFLKNGKKVGQLQGTQLSEMSELIKRHYEDTKAEAEVQVETQIKYTSIVAAKGKGSSAITSNCRSSAAALSWCAGIDENIRNLVRKTQASDYQECSPTKLWKNEMLLVD